MRLIFTAALLLLTSASASAQPKPDPTDLPGLRYEIGRRLKRFEAEWEKRDAPAARKRALAHAEKLTGQFFSFQYGEAGRTLDRATFALLTDDEPGATRQWVWSLHAVPEARLVDGGAKELTVTIKTLYPVKGEVPKDLEVQFWFSDKRITKLTPRKFPHTVKVPLPPLGEFKGLDRKLYFLVEARREMRYTTIGISQVADLGVRLTALKKAVAKFEKIDTPEKATARDRAALLADLARGAAPETDFPAANLFDNAEAMLGGKPLYTADRPGEFWVSVPTGARESTACRIFVPRMLDEKKPVPVVVALHGAGGSENLFFEGYGAGRIVAECRKRGWLLVAPRSGSLFAGAPPVPAILDQLARRYPLDPKRVFLVGHSMGAMQAVDLVQKHPGKFAGVALLGSGGSVRDAKPFAGLPTFIGIGEKDSLMLNAARTLNKTLTEAGAKKVTYREYPLIEHMVIVREALPDVFETFEAVAEK